VAWWVFGMLVFSLMVAIRIRLLGIPLERDEGEYAYAGQLMLQGVPPYKLAYNMKFPGTYAAYAAIMSIFGQTITGIHVGLLLVNAATVAVVFLLGRRLLNTRAGIVAGASYAVLSVSPSVLGFAGHATHFIILPALGGTLLLLRPTAGLSKKVLFLSGLLFGAGLLMKQPALLFFLFGAAYLFYRDARAGLSWRQTLVRNAIFGCGAAVPVAASCFLLWKANVFAQFWFWTFQYARQYGELVSFANGLAIFRQITPQVIGFGWLLWTLAGVGVIVSFSEKRLREEAPFLSGLLLACIIALCCGLYFRPHYFILVLPAVSLLVGFAVDKLANLLGKLPSAFAFFPLLLFGTALSLPFFGERYFFFYLSPTAASRWIYAEDPFPESITIAEYIREHTSLNDTIAVIGSEPQIYFYAHRHSATGYIYTYGLMEPQKYAHQMQLEMIAEIERAQPKYVVVVAINDSWMFWPTSERLILDWTGKYCDENYTLAGIVNILDSGESDYYFNTIPQPVPPLKNHILVFRRNS
jgi:Dolichyl-phosphate-mannose-protein mannosyltransferase